MSAKKSAYEVDLATLDLGDVLQVVGSLDARGLRFGIAVSRYNHDLTSQLVRGAVDALREHGAGKQAVTVVWVPGAYEVPSLIHKLASRGGYDALLGLGVVVQGETPHARLINEQVSHSLAQISRGHDVPVLDGIIPAGNMEQAVARCQTGKDGRGWYLGCAAIEMARLFRQLNETP
jgi:6,7-dimethyl-8-ribityllumazine synthase